MGGGIFEVPVCQEPCLVVLVLVMMLLVNVSFCHPILLQILLLMTYEGSLPIFFIPPFFLQNIISFSSPWYSDCLGRRLGPKLLGRTDDSGVSKFHSTLFVAVVAFQSVAKFLRGILFLNPTLCHCFSVAL